LPFFEKILFFQFLTNYYSNSSIKVLIFLVFAD